MSLFMEVWNRNEGTKKQKCLVCRHFLAKWNIFNKKYSILNWIGLVNHSLKQKKIIKLACFTWPNLSKSVENRLFFNFSLKVMHKEGQEKYKSIWTSLLPCYPYYHLQYTKLWLKNNDFSQWVTSHIATSKTGFQCNNICLKHA